MIRNSVLSVAHHVGYEYDELPQARWGLLAQEEIGHRLEQSEERCQAAASHGGTAKKIEGQRKVKQRKVKQRNI